MRLSLLPQRVALCRLPPDAAIPAWVWRGDLCSVTRTRYELSIVTAETNVPDGITCDEGWRVLKVRGPLDLDLTGVMAELSEPLAGACINIFTLSTFDTDHILVPEEKMDDAIAALKMAGHEIVVAAELAKPLPAVIVETVSS